MSSLLSNGRSPTVERHGQSPRNPHAVYVQLDEMAQAALEGRISEGEFLRQADVLMQHMQVCCEQAVGTPHAESMQTLNRALQHHLVNWTLAVQLERAIIDGQDVSAGAGSMEGGGPAPVRR